jgi:hypothetical protein
MISALTSNFPLDLSPLANQLWQSTIVSGVAALLAWALRKNAARIRYGLCCFCKAVGPMENFYTGSRGFPRARQRSRLVRHPLPRLVVDSEIRAFPYAVIFMVGRTSTEPPPSRMGQPLEISTACVRSLASITM